MRKSSRSKWAKVELVRAGREPGGIPMRIAQHLILGGTQTKAPLSIAAHIASNAFDFFGVIQKSQLLPLNAADCAWSRSIGMKKEGEHQIKSGNPREGLPVH